MSKEKISKEEKLYECEVKRIRVTNGKRSFFWKLKSVREALEDDDKEFRCKDCHGEVKLFRRSVAQVATPHVEHKRRQDSEYCRLSSIHFSKLGSVSGLMASAGHSGSQTPQSMHSSGWMTSMFSPS